jgi:hypothetical protein
MDNFAETAEQVATAVREQAEHIGAGLAPDEDWMPVLFTFGSADGRDVIAGLPDLGDPKCKPALLQGAVPMVIAQARPQWAALVTMGWACTIPDTLEGRAEIARREAQGTFGKVEGRPDANECLMVYVVGKDGTATMLYASVTRSETEPPVLAWEHKSADSRIEGALPDALRRGFAAAARGRG